MIIQHSDRNIGPADYKHLAHNELLVTSIFYTIQGEGPYAGCPAVFVRLAGCNRGKKEDMGCKFCDTKFFFDQGKVMTFAAITKEIGRCESGSSVTVITGGEPMMQDNLSMFVQYHRVQFGNRAIQIESNGDRLPRYWPTSGYAQIVVSPKIVGKAYHKPKDEVLKAAMCFKFVVSADPESPYHNVPSWALDLPTGIRRERVFVSPMTMYKQPVPHGVVASLWDQGLIDHTATRANYRHAAKLAMTLGLRVSIQQHLLYEVE